MQMNTRSRREREPLPIQYLGQSGITHPCVEAMATILSSPYRCREITVVFQHKQRGEDSYAACFVIWDWLGCEITIVPDGFGTHRGTGGWGLAVVLGLIKFYQIPLKEKWVQAPQFERIVSGHPTRRDCEQLHQADFGAPSWPLYLEEDLDLYLWAQIRRETLQFPYWVIEPELLADIKDFEQHPGSAVFRAARRLEMLVRSLDSALAELVGLALINQAMGEGRPWEPHGGVASERQAWTHLFRGVIGAIRNPEGHRDQQLTCEDAIGQIFTINMLVRKLKADFPDRFHQEEEETEEEDEGVSV